MAMMKMTRNATNPMGTERTHSPPTPTSRLPRKIGFLNPFVSARVPNTGPRKATSSVAMEDA